MSEIINTETGCRCNKDGWVKKKLGEVCDFQGGSQPPKEEWVDIKKEGYVRMLQIRDFTQSSTAPIEYVKISNRLKYCEKDDILLGRYGASVGKVLTGLSGAYNVAILKSIPDSKIVSKEFIKGFFHSKNFQSFLLATCKNRAAQAGFSKGDIFDFEIFVPPLAQQQRIVSELDCLNGIIEKQKEQLKQLDELAQSIFYEMFGDPVENEKGWEVVKLKKVSSLITNGTTPKGGEKVYVEDGILFLRSQNVWRNQLKLQDVAYIDEQTNSSMKSSILLHNDILITKTGRVNTENSSLGRAALFTGADNSANINGHVYLVRLKPIINPVYYLYALISDSYRELIRKVCVGAIDKRQLNRNHIEDFPVMMAPLSLQQQFASKIEAIEHQKELIKKSIAETETLFNSRMDYYFR